MVFDGRHAFRSFTLLELLIVIGVIAILGSITFITLNPTEILRAGRDAQRMADVNSLDSAMSLAAMDSAAGSFGAANTVYVSLPDTSLTCGSWQLPGLPVGWIYHCAPATTIAKTDGTGWIPVNFQALSIGSPIGRAPLDPTNDATKFYAYVPTVGAWELGTTLESKKYKMGGEQDKTSTDGGRNLSLFEKGTNLALLPIDFGDPSLTGWWKFDEPSWTNDCATATMADASGGGNSATSCPAGSGPNASVPGKVGTGIALNGITQYVGATNNQNLNPTTQFTVLAWINLSGPVASTNYNIFAKQDWGNKLGYRLFVCGYCANYLSMEVGNGTTQAFWANAAPVEQGAWHHVGGVFANGSMIIYEDGAVVGRTDNSGVTTISNLNAPAHIGNHSMGGEYFWGAMDDVRFYTRALSGQEIQAVFNATR